jgi:branched-chain amino acid transport system substrate-binding protein
MFSTWETLFFIKQAMEASGYAGPADRQKLVETMEGISDLPYGIERPQGAKMFNGKTHQVFGTQSISQVQGGKLVKVHQTSMADGAYDDAVDYTAMSF